MPSGIGADWPCDFISLWDSSLVLDLGSGVSLLDKGMVVCDEL